VLFLDLEISYDSVINKLHFSLYIKPTNTFGYLLPSSNHPKHIFANIPTSLIKRIRRICSSYADYIYHSYVLHDRLVKRGYVSNNVKSIIREIAKTERTSLLPYKNKDTSKKECFKLIINYDISGNSLNATIYPNYGVYTISSSIADNNSYIDQNTGILYFNKNIPVNIYSLIVYYSVYNPILNYTFVTTTLFNVFVLPNIYYSQNNITLLYNRQTYDYSVIPYVNPPNGIFDIQNTNISGIIFYIDPISGIINLSYKFNVGIYNLIIGYTYNNIKNTTNYILNIIPYIFVGNYTILTSYDRNYTIYTNQPEIDQSGGIFYLYDICNNLVKTKNAIVDTNYGIITISQNINVDKYLFQLYYSLNNTFSTISFNIIVKPNINYPINTYFINYGNTLNTIIPYTNPYNLSQSIFSLYDISNNLIINSKQITIINNGQIFFGSLLNVGIYNYIISYTFNNITEYTTVQLIVKPNLVYNINSLTLLYHISGKSILPTYNQPYGTFSILDQ
jgi:hypothetical protein